MPGLFPGLVGGTNLDPGLEGDDRSGPVFLEHDLESVGEAEVHGGAGVVAGPPGSGSERRRGAFTVPRPAGFDMTPGSTEPGLRRILDWCGRR